MNMKKFGAYLLCTTFVFGLIAGNLMAQRAPVNLHSAGNYVALSETGITDVPPSLITGNIGASPITGAAIHLTCAEVTGTISAVDAAGPAPCSLVVPLVLTPAINDMTTAYTDAAGRTIPDFTELGAGNISGRTLVPGLYKWSTSVLVDATGFTLSGGPNAVWIFQVAGDVTMASTARVTLSGGAQANNIFWQVGGPTGVTLGTSSSFYGTILSSKQVIMNTGATLIGRALAQTQVTLQSTRVTSPGPLVGGVPVVIAPTVSSTVPANLATSVPIGNKLTATFSEAMDPATITGATLTLQQGGTPVSGTVTYAGVTATFTPSSALLGGLPFTATITTGAKDLAGVALASNYVWTFTTGAAVDLTPPTVTSTTPSNNATGMPINSKLTANFSKAMDPATITGATFTLQQGVNPVLGTVTYAGVTATFTPSSSLAGGLPFTATITTGAKDLAGNALASNYFWSFTTGSAVDLTPPTVTSTVPAGGSTAVGINNKVAATFSKPMDSSTINTLTFTLTGPGGTPVTGTVAYAGTTATLTPAGSLASCSSYVGTITTGAKDLAGNALASNYVWSFATAGCGGGGGGTDTTPPTVISTCAANGATGLPVNRASCAIFSEPMDPLTLNTATFTLAGPGGSPVTGTVSYAGTTATFTPATNLAPNTSYTSTITTGAKDLAGNALASNFVWNWTTGSTADTTAPTVTSTTPNNGATGVAIGGSITVTFSEAMDPLTINTASFSVQQGSFGGILSSVAGTVTYAGGIATFTPAGNFTSNTTLTATITTGAKDLAGNPLASSYVWNWTTGTTGAQAPINFGSAVSFAVLAGSAVTNVGATNVSGDLGVSPGTAVTGFPPGTLTGTIHAGDAAAAQGQLDLTAAYNDAAGRSVGPVAVAGDIGGQILTPGLYKSVSSLEISAADLILDAKGDPNGVFIFQIASTFTTAAGRNIILTGGAIASNVIWQVGSSATLGANSAFRGIILANQSITVNSGTSLEGRLLARVGAVAFLGPVIVTLPVPGIFQGGTVNVASYTPTVAAGSIAAVFGNKLAFGQGFAGNIPLPTTLAGSSFQIGGRGAPLFYASPSQVNLQIPWELTGQTQATVIATVGAVVSNQQTVNIVPFAPGIFTLNQAGTGQGAILINGTAQIAAPQSVPGSRPAHPGEFISIYCTGLGAVSNQPATGSAAQANPPSVTSTTPTVTIGGIVVLANFSGLAPGTVGLYQVNVQVPLGAPAGDAVPLTLTIGGVTSNTVTIAVQ